MKYALFIFCCLTGLSASAQWYRVDLKLKKHERFPLLAQVKNHSIARLPSLSVKQIAAPKIKAYRFDNSQYSLEAAEAIIMHTAQHNMRFRIYTDASYNFTELARLYVQQNRFSEAKWYLLQSNIISKEENDDQHTISNLLELATIKANIGEYDLARQDLSEAHDLASQRGLFNAMKTIEKETLFITQHKDSTPKSEIRYAETAFDNAQPPLTAGSQIK